MVRLEKGNQFEQGPDYEGNGKVLASVRQTARQYEDMGYTRLVEQGDPPVYAMLQRGHRDSVRLPLRSPRIKQHGVERSRPWPRVEFHSWACGALPLSR